MRTVIVITAVFALGATNAIAQPLTPLSPIVTLDHDAAADAHTATTTQSTGRLAMAAPPGKQDSYRQAIAVYAGVEQSMRLPAGDAAGAVAFLVVNAYNQIHSTNNVVSTKVVDQIRGRLLANPAFQSASPTERRVAYEQAALAGGLLAAFAANLKDHPDDKLVGKVKEAATAYLDALANGRGRFNLDVDGLAIDSAAEIERRKKNKAWSQERIDAVNRVVIIAHKEYFGLAFEALLPDHRRTSILGLSDPAGLEAHLTKYPPEPNGWRQVGSRYEIRYSDSWKPVEMYRKQPRGTRITHEVSFGKATGGFSAYGTTKYTSDGRFFVKRGGGMTTQTGVDTSVSAEVKSSLTGTYEIDGYVITLRYNDGASESHIIEIDGSYMHVED